VALAGALVFLAFVKPVPQLAGAAIASALVGTALLAACLRWSLGSRGKRAISRARAQDAASNDLERPRLATCLVREGGDSAQVYKAVHHTGSHLCRFVRELLRIHAVELDALAWQDEVLPEDMDRVCAALRSLREVVALIRPSNPALRLEPLDDPLLGQCLMASDFDVARASELVKAYCTFRGQLGGAVAPPPETLRMGAILLPCEDRLGRPVLFMRGKYFDPSVPLDVFQRSFRAYMDAIAIHLWSRRPDATDTNQLEQYVCVIDTEGAGWANASLDVLKMMVKETNTFYPDRLQQVVVLGVTGTVRAMWRVAAPVVHPRTRKKVKLVGIADVRSTMQQLLSPNCLPSTYGGTAPPLLPPDQAVDLDARVGALAARIWRHHVEVAGASDHTGLAFTRATASAESRRPSRSFGWRSVPFIGGSQSQLAAGLGSHIATVFKAVLRVPRAPVLHRLCGRRAPPTPRGAAAVTARASVAAVVPASSAGGTAGSGIAERASAPLANLAK